MRCILFAVLVLLLSGCNKFEMIPVQDINTNTPVNNRFYRFKADFDFGETPPSTITVNSNESQTSKSYIKKSVPTIYIKKSYVFKANSGANVLKWAGIIVCIIISVMSTLFLDSGSKQTKKKKIQTTILITLCQIPLILFFIYIDYPVMYLFFWFIYIFIILFTMLLLSDTNGAFPVFLFFLFIWGFSGYKAGSGIYIDNACNYKKMLVIKDKIIGELPAKRYTKIRLAGKNPTIEIRESNLPDEKTVIPVNNNFKGILRNALSPWKKYIYNIHGSNSYYLDKVTYY